MRPYGLLRAGFPYLKTIGEFMRMHFPTDVAPARDGRLYVIGKGSMYTKGKSGPILVTNIEDDNLGSFGWKSYEESVADACFMWPMAIQLDVEQRELYISDSATHRISGFTTDGEYLGRWGEHGSGEGQFDRPSGLAIDSEDLLYVVDSMNHRVQKYTKDGRYISHFGEFGDGPGQFNMPWGITIDEEGTIYVADWRNDRIQQFSADGEFIRMFGTSGHEDGELYRPAGVAVDMHGDIYVCDWGNNRVQLFAKDGHFVQKFVGGRDHVEGQPGENAHPHRQAPPDARDCGLRAGEILRASPLRTRRRTRPHVRPGLRALPHPDLQEGSLRDGRDGNDAALPSSDAELHVGPRLSVVGSRTQREEVFGLSIGNGEAKSRTPPLRLRCPLPCSSRSS